MNKTEGGRNVLRDGQASNSNQSQDVSFCQSIIVRHFWLTLNTIEGLVSQVSVRRLSSSLSLRAPANGETEKGGYISLKFACTSANSLHFPTPVSTANASQRPGRWLIRTDSQSWRGRRPTPAVCYLLRRPVLPPLLRPFAAFFPRSYRPRQPSLVDNSMSIERRRKASPIIGQRCGQRRPPLGWMLLVLVIFSFSPAIPQGAQL
ncbi:hypothetical protein T4D_15510 [Trichinella pseudospiralis]|uniref:Uncharacterized protein n=1 Tax=Trichinella pseudospiralis TaxID=6337 RepID=A0A0V1FUJ8_TRIPS|nr:hypothetical protein T4D_15510 [Trichinella pseudospiralis]